MNRLWTAGRLQTRWLQHPPVYPLCCQESETVNHLTLQCSFSPEFWYTCLLPYIIHRFVHSPMSTIEDWWPTTNVAAATFDRREIHSLNILVASSIRLEQNSKGFWQFATMPMEVCRKLKVEMEDWKAVWTNARNYVESVLVSILFLCELGCGRLWSTHVIL
jgi:hypothetical protein